MASTYTEQLKEQSRMLREDLKNPEFRNRYFGKVIVYHNHEVLLEADSGSQAIARIPSDKKHLPLVVSTICEEDFMGGPKSERAAA